MSRLRKSKAIIIKTMPWHESSKIITLYAREWGLVDVIARGVMRRNNPFGGKLEILNLAEIVISDKSSRSLQILTDIALLNSFMKMRGEMDRLPYALAMSELIDQIFEERQGDPTFFDFCVQILSQMETASNPELVFWYFLLKLSSYLGFKPNLDQCKNCGKESTISSAYFSPENGAIFCEDCASGAGMTIRLSKEAFNFLRNLQNFPHRKISEMKIPHKLQFDFNALLLNYLNLHLDRHLHIRSLQLLMNETDP